MKIDDIVNIKRAGAGYWRGEVTNITTGDCVMKYKNPIYTVVGIDNPGHALVYDHEVDFIDGEYYDRK